MFTNSYAEANELNTHCNEKCVSPVLVLIVIILALKSLTL